MIRTIAHVENALEREYVSMNGLKGAQVRRCGLLGATDRAKWQSAVLAELAEPGHVERLSRVSQLVAGAVVERPATKSGEI